jgi:Ca2+-binding EF-hand superfamily protein
VIAVRAQDRSTDERSTTNVNENRSTSSRSGQSSRGDQSSGAETRLRYDDEENRLHLDVDEEIRFREGPPREDAWAEEGEFDLRYDSDRNTLTGQGEGTLQLDQVGSDMARWWQSWWEEERRTRRSRQAGAASGAGVYIGRHDENGDGFLSLSELPASDRSEFNRIDINDDGRLSRSEIQRYGDSLFDRRTPTNRATRTANQGDETWSEWWASWWSDDQNSRDPDVGSAAGARQFIRQHDDNNDGYISQREIPARMRDDFARVDRNNDNYLSLRELQQAGALLRDRDSNRDRNQNVARGTSRSNQRSNQNDEQTWSEWWASWWSDDQNNRDPAVGSEAGARQFIRQHDDNNDGYISQREIPARMRDDFARVDRNNDNYLSLRELQQAGALLRDRDSNRDRDLNVARGTSRSNQNDEQTWSEWWSSWWSDNDEGTAAEIADRGAREFIRRHDQNGDGYLVRSELPSRMYDEFAEIDRNDDRYLSVTEVRRYAQESRGNTGSEDRSPARTARSGHSPAQAAYVWIVDRNLDQTNQRDLQQAYTLLLKLDANRDGQISQNELAERGEQAVSQWCQELFERLDRNNDNSLSRDEALASIFGLRFDQFDKDGNGALTMSEIRQVMEQKFESQTSFSRDDSSDRR